LDTIGPRAGCIVRAEPANVQADHETSFRTGSPLLPTTAATTMVSMMLPRDTHLACGRCGGSFSDVSLYIASSLVSAADHGDAVQSPPVSPQAHAIQLPDTSPILYRIATRCYAFCYLLTIGASGFQFCLPPNMKFLFFVALGASIASAAPSGISVDRQTQQTPQKCTQEAIGDCVAATGLSQPACFAQVCTTSHVAELRRRKTSTNITTGADDEDGPVRVAQNDDTPASCTEDNLLDCAVNQYKNPDICFQQLCL
jgi:hypothetical protein